MSSPPSALALAGPPRSADPGAEGDPDRARLRLLLARWAIEGALRELTDSGFATSSAKSLLTSLSRDLRLLEALEARGRWDQVTRDFEVAAAVLAGTLARAGSAAQREALSLLEFAASSFHNASAIQANGGDRSEDPPITSGGLRLSPVLDRERRVLLIRDTPNR